ncbi:hypothetical protein LDL59_15640 [Kaistella anthropi]|nr:hypothetical protein [Kaistella anthropi]
MNFAVSGSKVSFFELLPKDSLVVSKNAFLGFRKTKDFYEKAGEKYKSLSKEITHRKPEELFVSEEILMADYQKFKSIDFTINALKFDSLNVQQVELNQTQQPTFNKNFEFLIDDLNEKKMPVLMYGFHFPPRSRKSV